MTTTRRTTRRRHRFLPAALVFLGGLILSTSATAQFTVSPAEIKLVPGTDQATSFVIENAGRLPTQLSVYANDWDRNNDGENTFYPLGTVPGSCGERVKVFPQTLRIDAGARQSIRVSIEGESFMSPCWVIVFVESTPRPSNGPSRVTYIARIGVKVYISPPNLPVDAEVTGFALEHRHQSVSGPAVDTTQQEFALRVHNTGGLQARFQGRIEIRNLGDQTVATIPVEEFPVLPGSSRRLGFAIPTLPQGKYVALAVLSYGGEEDLAAQLELEIR